MCFREKDGSKLITSRVYYIFSGNRFIGISADKKSDRYLVLETGNERGEIAFILENKTTGEKIDVDIPLGEASQLVPIEKDMAYMLRIKASKAIGHYRVAIKKAED